MSIDWEEEAQHLSVLLARRDERIKLLEDAVIDMCVLVSEMYLKQEPTNEN